MANPFPGMDPYLEGPIWQSVHNNLVEEIARQIAPKLRPKYLALTTQRVVIAPPDETALAGSRYPDVQVISRGDEVRLPGGAATAAPLMMEVLLPEPIPHSSVEIRDVVGRRLVTAIEVLSPTNKRGVGREEYSSKREELLASEAHLVEIDLLRVGERFPVAPPLPSVPYFVFISRSPHRNRAEVWPIALDQVLPTIDVPLLPGDPAVALDLQEALAAIYQIYAYDEAIDYHSPPPGPLSDESRAWIEERLVAAGKRSR